MEVLYFLIPLGLILALLVAWGFLWAVGHGQFDDLEGPAYSILLDEDEVDDRLSPPSGFSASGREEPIPGLFDDSDNTDTNLS
ncbi:MAG: cbb3-type cytochrome oxidase assembly protein CcoS [Gammaproteobacteria bacterium]|nr:cbb3-type cytochrome oxidase assembly protein CcoS [Gammaproteobacteria bacterium]MDH3465109.1 cbb3-type cytochrome oxidase assembly protein CcoS [Gammaproteobacteria bacterium]